MSRAIAYPVPHPDFLRQWLLALLLAATALTGMHYANATDGGTATNDKSTTAIFAGGCFWCMQADFDKVPGVLSTTAGYTGGSLPNPTYEQVSSGKSGHLEAVLVRFDPNQTSYSRLLEAYWPNIDPLTATGQFCDHGPQYRSVIFYNAPMQQRLAEASKEALQASGRFTKPIVTEILPAGPFYPAEEYHQNYYQKNPLRYHFYRATCGRDARLKELWGQHP